MSSFLVLVEVSEADPGPVVGTLETRHLTTGAMRTEMGDTQPIIPLRSGKLIDTYSAFTSVRFINQVALFHPYQHDTEEDNRIYRLW